MANWTKVDGILTYDTTVSNDFNLHLEKSFASVVVVSMKTAGTKYAPVASFSHDTMVIDSNFKDGIYPSGGLAIRLQCLADKGTAADPTVVITEDE